MSITIVGSLLLPLLALVFRLFGGGDLVVLELEELELADDSLGVSESLPSLINSFNEPSDSS